uniref:Rho GTPase activating protein 25 n=1 Tax=Saimiri boliviensis boliviensis TaxID=39432 RepID=A0A2K6S1W2_SAIBB
MSLKLPRTWDFNLKVEAAKIARSRSVMTGEQMAAFHPSSTPNPLERPIKMGWLKKQRSIVKNWQQRYFVLRAQQLYYYKDEEDTKPQQCLASAWMRLWPMNRNLAPIWCPSWWRSVQTSSWSTVGMKRASSVCLGRTTW